VKLPDIGIIGVGAIAEAIVTGLCEAGDVEARVHLSPRGADRAARLAARYPAVEVADANQAVADRAGAVFLCVRPEHAEAVVGDLAFRPDQTVISVMAGIPIAALRDLTAPAADVARAIPLPPVARRSGLTPVHPRNELAATIFELLGGALVLDEEAELETLAASTATLAAHMAYLGAISGWLAERGVPREDAARFVAGVYGGLAGTLLEPGPKDFDELAAEFATPGGYNEQFHAALREAGVYDEVERGLDAIARRLEAGA
jgi:pyrroline-5-carboxylate reductase